MPPVLTSTRCINELRKGGVAGLVLLPTGDRPVPCQADRTRDGWADDAGIGGPPEPVWETPAGEWWQAVQVNLHGTVLGCHAVLLGMVPARAGRVINIVSMAGDHKRPHASAYSVAKTAIIKLNENRAAELRPYDVQVFSPAPGPDRRRPHARHPELGLTGKPWTDRMGNWLHRQRDAGQLESPRQAVESLLHLTSGAADTRPGDYFCPENLCTVGSAP
jgi:NAD(P)-dependent dehydrogenase (short-subunit alcohol dehydrogenase family)